ncbi:MAG TPA: response regulator [Desulfuromonadaceae bacterium]
MNLPPTKLILVVEDEEAHAELIRRSFSDAAGGYELTVTGTLREARELLAGRTFDIVLTDYRLPDGDGKGMVASVAGLLPVVMMTSQGNEQVAVEAMKSGAADYVVKTPETFDSMPRIVERALREWNLVLENKRAEKALRDSEKRYRTLFESASDGICYLTSSGDMAGFNESFATMHGYTVEEMSGMTLKDLDTQDLTHLMSDCITRIMAGEQIKVEVEHYHKNGHRFPLEVSTSLLPAGDQQFIVAFHRDITERREAEHKRIQMEIQLRNMQRLESLGVLAGGIAHDFNNLLTVILGNTCLAQEIIGPASPALGSLRQVEKASQRAADLCQQMLAYAGKGAFLLKRLNLQALVEDMASLLNASISKKVSLNLDLRQGLPPIQADPSQVRQIIMNLIINASEAIGEKSGTITVAVDTVEYEAGAPDKTYLGEDVPPGRYVRLEVTDNGCGMDEATRQRIFEPFFTTKFTGRGLGMSAVLGIIKAYNGFLQLSSVPGRGSTFKIHFPAAVTGDEAAGPLHEAAPPLWREGATVLLVEDEQMVSEVGRVLLESLGLSVLTAANGCEAVERYRGHPAPIDLVLLDMNMPLMDGAETFSKLRRHDPNARVVITSGFSGQDITARFTSGELAGFIHKPYTIDGLKRLLMEVLPPVAAGAA